MRWVAVIAALAGLGGAGAVAAQDPDWTSEQNKVFWNGVTEAELRELVAEAGGTWTDRPDRDGVRHSHVNWPDLANVMIEESRCSGDDLAMPEKNCGTLELYVHAGVPTNWVDAEGVDWEAGHNRWLGYSESFAVARVYRIEHHQFGTTRGHVLADLMMFRAFAVREIAWIKTLAREP